MGHPLLPRTNSVVTATMSDTFERVLDSIEDGFLHDNRLERLMTRACGSRANIIDMSSAARMHLFEPVMGRRLKDLTHAIQTSLTTHIQSYPYLIPKEQRLEKAFVRFVSRWTGTAITPDEITVFNGVYGSFRTILGASVGSRILVPEYIHQINKACFASLGKQVVEICVDPYTKLLDLEQLEQQLSIGGVSHVYLYHAQPVNLTRDYYQHIARLLKKYGATGIVDMDVIHATYQDTAQPALPLTIPTLRARSIFLFNVSKELGAPGIRIGFGVAPKALTTSIRRFQRLTLEMIPPLNRAVAEQILNNANLDIARRILRGRMEALRNELASMGFKPTLPPYGVNLFLHTPERISGSRTVLPDHLFSFHVLTKAHVLLRPASLHGHRLNHFIRVVLCQPQEVIQRAMRRMRTAGIHADMPMPTHLEKTYHRFMRQVAQTP